MAKRKKKPFIAPLEKAETKEPSRNNSLNDGKVKEDINIFQFVLIGVLIGIVLLILTLPFTNVAESILSKVGIFILSVITTTLIGILSKKK